MSWSTKRTSRWSNLKTDKTHLIQLYKLNREPLKTNSRWASLKSSPSPKREKALSPSPNL